MPIENYEDIQYASPHPELKGRAIVRGAKNKNDQFTVDFDTGLCNCQDGNYAYYSKNKGWTENRWCTHKLRALASIIDTKPESGAELRRVYWTKLSKNYIVWEAVSAMHKELRRGDVDAAIYWAMVVAGHRGTSGIISYLLNIVFEETRDIPMYRYLLRRYEEGKRVTLGNALAAVERFCLAPKKWQLPHRLETFLDEMRGYQSLVMEYGADVAKPKEIIAASELPKLGKTLFKGYAEGDRVLVQKGLKGMFKSKSSKDHRVHKLEMFNILTALVNGEYDNAFDYDEEYCFDLQALHMRRITLTGELGYHELNSLADALCGETPDDRTTIPSASHKRVVNRPTTATPDLGTFRAIPIYAQDNHTYRGKALMRSYGAAELQPGAKQDHMDFRWCGAYMGVAWRHLAYRQHGSCDVPWGSVRWNKPSWLWKHLDAMWY